MIVFFACILYALVCLVVFFKDLELVLVMGSLSLISMIIYTLLGAPDVAMTEAALGVGLSTILVVNYSISQTKHKDSKDSIDVYKYIFYFILFSSIGILVSWLFGNEDLFLNSSIIHQYYVENTYKDIHIDSFIAGILACYRGFDTLIETCVVFIGGIGVFYIFSINDQTYHKRSTNLNQQHESMYVNNILITGVVKVLLIYMILFALYIQLNGTVSPGGGFQFGGILASICIIVDKFVKNIEICLVTLLRLGAIGVLIYFIVGFIPLFFNLNFLDYTYLHSNPQLARHIGIELIELGVGITVFAMLYLIYNISEKFNV